MADIEKTALTDQERYALWAAGDHHPDLCDCGGDDWSAEHRRAESHACSPDIPLGRAARLMREALSLSSAWCLCGQVDDRGDGSCGNCGLRIMTGEDELSSTSEGSH